MSEIQFKDLAIENFLSIGKGEIALNDRGLLLIQGLNDDDPSANSNGAGKSSCVDALCWAIYGVTARGLSGDAVVNRFEGKNCRVAVDFTLNGKTYTVARHRKHKSGKNRLLFTCDGDDLTLGTDRLTQESIERTIGCALDVFTASIYAGQNQMPNLPAMTDKELKQLVERAAGIELLDAAYDIARDRSRALDKELMAATNTQNLAAQRVEQAKESVADAERTAVEWDRSHEETIAGLRNDLVTLAGDAKKQREVVDSMDKAAAEARIAEIEQQIESAAKPLPPLDPPQPPEYQHGPPAPPVPASAVESPRVRELDMSIARLISQRDSAKSQLTDLLGKIINVDATIGQPCSECNKPHTKEDVEPRKLRMTAQARDLKEQLSKIEASIANDKAERDELEAEFVVRRDAVAAEAARLLKEYDDALALVREHNNRLKRDYEAAQEAHQQALQERRAIEASSDSTKLVAALRDAQSALQRISNEQSKLTQLVTLLRERKTRFDTESARENPHHKQIEIRKEALAEAVEKLDAATTAMEATAQRYADAQVVAEMFSPKGIRGQILDSVTPFLNARTGQYLGTLSDGAITAEWKTVGETGKGELREKFHISVSNVNGAEVYEGLSGGEQRKVRISTAMALQDLVASRADRPIKLFVADEVDDALDVSGLERLMDILEEKARYVGSVVVISHRDLSDWISNQITVIKEGGRSTLVEL